MNSISAKANYGVSICAQKVTNEKINTINNVPFNLKPRPNYRNKQHSIKH